MPDFRCYCEPASLDGETARLSKEESNHLVAANRARAGDPVRLFDGSGREWEAVLTLANKHKAELRITRSWQTDPPMRTVALAQALPKGKLLESIIRKATELGIQSLHPIVTARTESKIAPKREAAKNEKWQAATIEGAKQSGNSRLVDIRELVSFSDFLADAQSYDLKLVASLTPSAKSLKTHLETFTRSKRGDLPASVVWLVGPEGDFTDEESSQAFAAGFLPTTLGPHVMRCETAAIHALSMTQFALS